MNLTELSKHDKIGIDFDGTLVEHERSHLLQRFIVENQGAKEFHIITFRTHGRENEIKEDLAASTLLTQVPIRMSHFVAIHSMPYDLREDHEVIRVKTPHLILLNDPFYGWKAERCLLIGCTALIDDMEPAIAPHCKRLGVVCLNPNHF